MNEILKLWPLLAWGIVVCVLLGVWMQIITKPIRDHIDKKTKTKQDGQPKPLL